MIFKWLTIPWSNRTKQIQVPQLWYVRWESRYDKYGSSTQPEVEAFTSEQQANEFAESLRKAFKLIKHTSGTNVLVSKP